MEKKLNEVKLAILDRILTNISDSTKSLNVETIVSFAGIVETFDRTEEMKKQPKRDPDIYYKALMEILEKKDRKPEAPQVEEFVEETL